MTENAPEAGDSTAPTSPQHESARGLALQLIAEITQCSLVEEAWAQDGHPCGKIVATQSAAPERFQVPEPWAGHLHLAPLLLVSSNPSISENEPYPVWTDSAGHRTTFFDERFGAGRTQVRDGVRHPLKAAAPDGSWHSSPVRFWQDCLSNVRFLLDRDPRPGVDYVMTEVVHCKSRGEAGVGPAVSTCVTRWFDRVLGLSPASVIVTVGAVATRAVADHLGVVLPLWGITAVEVAGRPRLIMAVRHTNYHGPRKWSEQVPTHVVNKLRAALGVSVAPMSAHPGGPEGDAVDTPLEDRGDRSAPSLMVQRMHPAIAQLCERAADMEAGSIRFELQNGALRLYSAGTGIPFGRITLDDTVMLTLPQGEAQRGHEQLGGWLDEYGDRTGTWTLEMDAETLDDPRRADQALVLVLRALHAAAAPPEALFAAPLLVDHVVDVLVEADVWSDGPEDMAAYWSARRDALLHIFGLATASGHMIEGGAVDAVDDLDRHAAWATVSGVARELARDASPVQGLECPETVHLILQPHLKAQAELEQERQRQGRATIKDLLRFLNPALDAVVATEAELASRGVPPRPPRDEVQLIMDGWF